MEDSEHGRGAADPAQAFEDLRAEVSVLRRGVEALPGAWEATRPPDYSPDLGRIVQGLAVVAGRLDAIQRHPALSLTPEQHRQAIAQAGNLLMREAAETLDRATREAERERQRLAGLIGTARTRDRQFAALCRAGGIALAIGLLLSPVIAGMLPFGLDTRVAALVMRDDRWEAGMTLMQAGNPDSWRGAVASWTLVRANQDALAACSEAATRARQEQPCTITVAAPAAW